MNLYPVTIERFVHALSQLDTWLDAAAAYAQSKKFDEANLLNARLAPDQFAFVRQVQSACDTAKFAPARLTGQKAPPHPDTEATIAELKTRVRAVIEYLGTFDAATIDASADRHVTMPWVPGKYLLGSDYVLSFALPNFYFHVTTAYSILRHNGVPLGKMDFLGALPFRES